MGHFISGRQAHGHRNHGPQKMDLSRLVDKMLFQWVIRAFLTSLRRMKSSALVLLCGFVLVVYRLY